MKVRYNSKEDILIHEPGPGKIGHAEEIGPMIVHYDKKGKPLLLEMLDASEFITASIKATYKARNGHKVEI